MPRDSVITLILERFRQKRDGEILSAYDFLDLGEYHAVRKALLRLAKAGKIQRVMRGLYYCPRYCKLIDEYEAPSPDNIAKTLARKYGWTIAPCGATALNQLGLSAQVPAKWSYISDGPYRTFKVGSVTIEFRHTNNREISKISRKTATIIQALKAIGKDNIAEKQLNILKCQLSDNEKAIAIQEAQQATVWVYSLIKQICAKTEA
ncbi:MAG: DUF6088 family protein [Desulfovibrionaceae bacterium]|nr:DUF6088 family protein [Desulfovibrionaceae bacterium]